jgi:hypothetical protein
MEQPQSHFNIMVVSFLVTPLLPPFLGLIKIRTFEWSRFRLGNNRLGDDVFQQ